jgi:Glyoxalase/Bleomycin resistance protein/Dioxygenase superfamily
MDAMISSLLNRFERVVLTRQELVQGLTTLAATSGTTSIAHAQEAGIQAAKIGHVSIQVSDLPRSIAFYQKMFGLTIVSEDKPNEIVRLGAGKVLVSLHHKSPTGLVDHFAISVERFDKEAVTRRLKEQGVTPENNLDAVITPKLYRPPTASRNIGAISTIWTQCSRSVSLTSIRHRPIRRSRRPARIRRSRAFLKFQARWIPKPPLA